MTRENQDIGSAHLIRHRLDSLYEVFHENTKIRRTNEALLGLRISKLRKPAMVAMMSKGYNYFPQLQRVELPREVPPTRCSLEEAIWRRRSVRDFTGEPLTLGELSQLLLLTYGVTGAYEFAGGNIQQVRAAPSGGALYPVELYVIAQQTADLPVGAYHYCVSDHALERLPDPANLAQEIETLSHYKNILVNASALFVFTAVFARNTFKYGDRGYRFILLDAGHAAQNLLLVTAALDLGAVALGGFRDDQLSAMVGADGVNEAAVYLVAVGRPTREAMEIAQRQRQFLEKGATCE